MIERHHQQGDTRSSAVYSDCGAYRYALTRRWGAGPRLLYVMLNPSTATETANDPTIERCQRRAVALGYGAFRVVNLFGLRATRPADLKAAAEPIGPGNDAAIIQGADWAQVILCAWGVHGAHRGRDAAVLPLLRDAGPVICNLGLTNGGQPRHPLYISYSCRPQRWIL